MNGFPKCSTGKMTVSPLEIDRIKDQPLSDIVGRRVTWDRAKTNPGRRDFWACCPFHPESSPSFHVDDAKGVYKCFGCGASGDHISFVMDLDGLSFHEAVEKLGGRLDAPKPSPEELAAEERKREARRAEQQRYAEQERAREIRKAREILSLGGPVRGTEGADYMRGRGLLPCPVALPLKFVAHMKYWHSHKDEAGKDAPYVLFSGPALILPILGPDAVQGVHITWIDPFRPGSKMKIVCPESGEALPSRKIRGSKRRSVIVLHQPRIFDRIVIGEGWETTLSVMLSEMRGAPERFARTAYWVSISLQHMGGKAAATVPHPVLKTKTGRALMVPGPVPDRDDDTAVLLPPHVTEVLRLGDSDSDRFTAEQVHLRARARWARPGLTDRSAWAPEGKDFNDIHKEELADGRA